MQTYRILVWEGHNVPEEVREKDGITIEAESLDGARDQLAEEMLGDHLIMREEYEDEIDFILVSDSLREVMSISASIGGM